ncbi:hypothetical protein SAMD00019534_046200 [Acytostelium subglobosum LB1]|uniref:hypothetical protein n=1 Tax=Acytostelium subglobosum LB1 TaxID=1410327 RepID=UPI000644AD90|nr:hypothetical protein SAMD00019534_046200 [Acytostelium subglobosum LB1]GAM21445.1 hypothetical protein SAMD00019534_046200 [Acytostelium subglobosum LB1]|eukprot:XP_012755564.1 hypothetical protein SAMD00019534_046200 [Acytostelium subglobosum LB1]
MKVNIRWNNESSIEYSLLQGVKLRTQLDVICQMLKIDDSPDKYALFVKDMKVCLTDDLLSLSDTQNRLIHDNQRIELILAPEYQVDTVVEALNHEPTIKKGLFDLKTHLQVYQQSNFIPEFIKKDGIILLQSIIMETSGNTLSLALSAFELIIHSAFFNINMFTSGTIQKIVSQLDHHSINISNPSLKIAITLTGSSDGYKMLVNTIAATTSSLEISQESIYGRIIANLGSSDVNTQTYSLWLINNLIANSESSSATLDQMEQRNLSTLLKKQLASSDTMFRRQIYRLQNLKLQEFVKDCSTQYSKDDPAHEKMLETLWNSMFTDSDFQKVDENWKTIGFQGKDPSTDFRGMGIAGLKHLVYFSTHHLESLRTMTSHQCMLQSSNNDRYYPVAACGIHITSMLLELIKPPHSYMDSNTIDFNILPILFDGKNSIGEIYCITLEVFAMVWDEGGARYMDFSRVISYLKTQIAETLSKASSLQEFRTNNFVMKRLVDYKRIFESNKTTSTSMNQRERGNPRHSKSFLDDKKTAAPTSNDYITASCRQADELLSKSYSLDDCHDILAESRTADGNSALHVAITNLSYALASQFLSQQSMNNLLNSNGMTPLNLACQCSTSKMIDLILTCPSVNVNIQSTNGAMPIHSFSSRKWTTDDFNRILRNLLDKGADIDGRTGDTMDTPLHIAIAKDLEENIKMLLAYGANPNVVNKKGETALHIAIQRRQRETIEHLLRYGSDQNQSNTISNETCEDMAATDSEILRILRAYRSPDEAYRKPPPPLPKRPSSGSPADSSRSLSPTPPETPSVVSPGITSPRVTSPGATSPIKGGGGATPIRHSSSTTVFESPTSPPSARPAATSSPPSFNIGGGGGGAGTSSSYGSSSSSSTNNLMGFISRAGRSQSGGVSNHHNHSHSSSNSSSSGGSSNNINNMMSNNTKQLVAIDMSKKKLTEALGLVEHLYSNVNDCKAQKETIKRIVENLMECKSNLKNIK